MRNDNEEEIKFLRAKVQRYEAVLRDDKRVATTFGLTSATADILKLLLSLDAVTSEMIRQQLAIGTDAKVAVCRLRHALKPWNVKVNSKRGLGYWLDQATKEFIRQKLDGSLPAQVTA
jgi:hypothetical protein